MGAILNGIKEKMEKDNNKIKIEKDEEWAYLVGQLCCYLFQKSETSSNKHSLLNQIVPLVTQEQVKKSLQLLFERYKHTIDNETFNHYMSEVLDYNPTLNFLSLKIPFYIGYFNENVIVKNDGGN